MPGVAAIANTFNSPDYVGELFALSPSDTPFLSSIGGLTGGRRANGIIHTWTVYDLRAPDGNRQRLEGADAPPAETRARGQDRNVLEIHQETVGITYTRQATQQMFAGTGSAHPNAQAVGGATNAVANEFDWQTRQTLNQIARDVELTFIAGRFQEPSDNSTVRKTRGILDATRTNVITNAQPKPLTEAMVLDLLQKGWESGGIQVSETATIMCGATQRRALTAEFITKKNYREETRNVGGVSVDTITTDFGRLNVMLNRYMPADVVQVVSLDQCAPVLLETLTVGALAVAGMGMAPMSATVLAGVAPQQAASAAGVLTTAQQVGTRAQRGDHRIVFCGRLRPNSTATRLRSGPGCSCWSGSVSWSLSWCSCYHNRTP